VSGSFEQRSVTARRDATRSTSPGRSAPRYLAALHRTIGNQAVGHLLRGSGPTSPGASAGAPLDPAFRAVIESRLASDFGGVRVHTGPAAARSARYLGAQAFTVGGDIVLGAGAPAPGTPAGRSLLAHELAHVVQQAAGAAVAAQPDAGVDAEREADAAATAVTRGQRYAVRARTGVAIARQRMPGKAAKTLDEELDEELRKHSARNPRALDPDNPDYAFTLTGYGVKLTREATRLRPEPKDPKAKAEWTRRFVKSQMLADRILSRGGPNVEQKENQAHLLAADLATAGFVDDAMALARRLTDHRLRAFLYNSAMDRPDKITPAQVAEITKFHVSRQVGMSDHPVLADLQRDDGSVAKQLTPDKINAALAELIKAYGTEPGLPHELARVLYFHPGSRAGFTKLMIDRKWGALLRKVSEDKFFVEGTRIETPTGTVNPSERTLAWAIANKRQVAVADVLALTSAAGLPVKPPKALDPNSIKAWLEANTEIIAAAVKKQHPGDPAAAEALLNQMTGAFMYHVDRNIEPDPGGKISHLRAGGPAKSQLMVDCDVLATYGVRFLVSSGFTPVGYMSVVPTDKDRAGHAMALLQRGEQWHAVSNMDSRALPAATTKEEALRELRDFGIENAYDPGRPLTGFQIFYKDSDAKGRLPAALRNLDQSTMIPELGR
jgi:hypothetical protein